MINHVEPYYGEAERKAVEKYLKSGGFLTEYTYTKKFESMLAKFLNVPFVSCVPSGTAALYLSLLASGVGPGDEVIVPDLTMIATANAVRMVGATVKLVDVAENGCINYEIIEDNLTEKTKAVIAVDLNGRSGEMDKIRNLAKSSKFILVEDACQALGSKYKGKYLGTFGRFGCFSLGFHKIITTGQGGFIVTHTKEDYETIERLKDFGRLEGGSDIHDYLGFNFKFTDLQAVIGIEQLKTIKWRMEKKRKLYGWYFGAEPPIGYVPWFIEEYSYFDRDGLKRHLKKIGIETRVMYPPIHTQKIYKVGKPNFPTSEFISDFVLWLPSSLSLTKKQVEIIVRETGEFYEDV